MRLLPVFALTLAPALASAQDVSATAAAGSPYASMLPLVLIFVIFYFLLIKPQQKRFKEHTALLGALKKGDMVITNGGLLGKVVEADKDGITTIEIASGVEVKVTKSSVASLVEKPGAAVPKKKSKDPAVKNDNVVLKKDQIANDN